MSYTALVFGEQAVDIIRSIRPLFLTLVVGSEHTELLAQMRSSLADDITELVNELGPQIYPEFSTTRIADQLGQTSSTHSNAINMSVDAFHRSMRNGEQALRQRFARSTSPSDSPTHPDCSDHEEPPAPRQRRASKYTFSPPTPRTMESLNSISPVEFLSTATGALTSLLPSSSSSDTSVLEETPNEAKSNCDQPQEAGTATPESSASKGLFFFT
ncbi:Glycerol-3-phosphate/dihydroxyacetone phosphate acyltransferase [Coemansia brasiliensis]|uniref:Glycerol-3-phosphate/dihydroxyacetone phosphate acyltransferase n=1 Tax=Coemansia brasiliensis TaxID=2650707 RepID=A0A9W8I358_9FUNG|nr:Glycerol-3-phosphate/dihydroxyacetone phosphate acyltransferase [Coemansia brasiliensis]